MDGCASLLALDAKRVMRPVLAAHRDRGFGAGDVMNAGPIRFAWTREGGAGPWATVDASLVLGPDRGRARLTLVHQAGRRTTGPLDQRVALEAVRCRFGGVRWWWVCPATGRRAAKLYLPGGGARFLSRQAHGLAYASQREDEVDRSHRRAARLHGLLGSPCRSAFGGTPAKPKWIRSSTYGRLAAELQDIDATLDEATDQMAARFLA